MHRHSLMTNQQQKQLAYIPPPPPQKRLNIAVPPRPPAAAILAPCASPSPLTLVSSFWADSDGWSFSELLAGAMYSPLALESAAAASSSFLWDNSYDGSSKDAESPGGGGAASLTPARSPLFTVPPGLSPSGLLFSPALFSPKSPFGMSHQQALAQVTAQAQSVLAPSNKQLQPESQPLSEASEQPVVDPPSFLSNEGSNQQMQRSLTDLTSSVADSSDFSSSTSYKWEALPIILAKPAEDGYNWRKYGQKQVKGCGYPRSYYKCSQLNCPVKKKIEHSLDGQVTEIVYRGNHCHEMPLLRKSAKDTSALNGGRNSHSHVKLEVVLQGECATTFSNGSQSANMVADSGRNEDSSLAISNHTSESSHYEHLNGAATGQDGYVVHDIYDNDEDEDENEEYNFKQRNILAKQSEAVSSNISVTESKIILQTRSEVDLLDDGYKWRKYGQKVVKGNSYPRSYYKCTYAGCSVRKHIERPASDPKSVITTYEGKHNHNIPDGRKRGRDVAGIDFGRPSVLRLKEEQVAA